MKRKTLLDGMVILIVVCGVLGFLACANGAHVAGEHDSSSTSTAETVDPEVELEFDSRPRLIIEDEDIAAWMVTNNEFAREHTDPNDPDSPMDRDYWSGVLIQLGHYKSGSVKFKEAHITFSNGGEETLPADSFTWMNIVSGAVGGREEPMDAGKHEYELYPNQYALPNDCSKAYECAGRSITCDTCTDCGSLSYGPLHPECVRDRTLHNRFVWEDGYSSIVTYWQGGHGYTITAMQDVGGHHGNRTSYTFSFRNNARVNVYDAKTRPQSADPIKSWGAGQVKKIELRFAPKGPNHGNHQDPVWPRGGGY